MWCAVVYRAASKFVCSSGMLILIINFTSALTNRFFFFLWHFQVLRFYAVQCDSYTLHLTHAIGSFIKTVEHNQPPKVFLAHGKFVILCAHRLVHIGDTVSRNVSYGEVSAKVLAITNSLAETLAATVHKIKKAALQFPSSVAVQEMVDSVFDMSDIANGLRLYVNYSSKI